MSGLPNQVKYLSPLRLRSRIIERGIIRLNQRGDNDDSPMPLGERSARRRHYPPQQYRQRSQSPPSQAGPSQLSGVGNIGQSSRDMVLEASNTTPGASEGNASHQESAAPEPQSSEPLETQRLPPRVAKRMKRIEGLPSRPFTQDDELTSCLVCLEEFINGEQVIYLPCTHIYHRGCLRPWLRSKPRCPMCRRLCFK
ncbi:RING finger protein 11-like [Hyla sarda]|uniref:RING finger protein 11-like n=1 Tax=Hyla sarda TaxID=327740 RepID=UPI0024C3D0FC|nr:RING finger protein 11-like [Hyla sarda]